MTIRMILSLDRANSLGYSDGRLAYRLPADLKRFKALTTNGTVVMGINTFLSLNRIDGLPNRRNIVLSHRPYSEIRTLVGLDVEIISNFDWILKHDDAAHRTVANTDREPSCPWIIGGASVFDEALTKGIVDEIYLTLVHSTCDADVRLTTDLAAWKSFVLHEAKLGRLWDALVDEPIWDGEHQTTYITLRKATS